jgi:Restriction endonuclease
LTYINVPEWGKCTAARVIGPYVWRFEDDDFNHRFPVDPNSLVVFDRNDALVHPALSARLKLRSRWWHIYLQDEFEDLIGTLKTGVVGQPRTLKDNLALLTKEIRPLLINITERIHHTHPNTALEALLAEVFKHVPGVKKVKRQGGAGDYGADLIVDSEVGLPVPGLQKQVACVIQVKSFEGEHWDTKAVEDIRRAFDHYPEVEMGLIVSTVTSSTEALESALNKLREETGKSVSLLIGADVAAFLLRFGGQSLA